ncbi:Flp pilus assembly protein TadG [Saccharothrix ecbatanensis]|uniref:Flp pilus assembly protein TadG n=1 Tax=Saccharothrix ecbatanensis TaxID=1105145 RepID=A0A7W9LZ39_9PSEU|nr:TadE/TadG family type IV pilus assembly protein [Saccharothrix ecbatanensis]MBB5801297.1 Flp pilus assembly protein TadG [Saccharothrix ecbatanensis]
MKDVLGSDRGAVSADLTLVTPLLLLMLLLIVQFALWSHAAHIAQVAASQGLAAARTHGGSAELGAATAQRVLDDLARGPLRGVSISADRGTVSASMRITGTATAVVPFLDLKVHAEAAGPVERYVPPTVSGATS